MNRDDGNAFVNFALYAVLGKMAEADQMMREFGDGIARASEWFAERWPVPRATLYRGMLVDPAVELTVDARYTFVSWSEDVDVACWFATPSSKISQPLAASNPRLRGVVLELAEPERVIFHYSWARGWERLAMMHPHMGSEGARQIRWSLTTQREVITAPLERYPSARPVGSFSRDAAYLDAKLAPPWID